MANSNLACGPFTVKYLVFLFNLLFFLSGIALIAIGGVAQGFFKENVMFFENEYETPAIGLIIVGTIIMLVSFFGCCGARKENVCMLRLFSCLMFVLLICEVAAAVTVLALKDDIATVISGNMKETLDQYGNDNHTVVTKTWDDLQKQYDCCGVNNASDWKNTTFGINGDAPDSCCLHFETGCGKGKLDSENVLFTEGCLDALKDSAHKNLGAIIGGAIGLILIQMVGIWMSCCLIKSVQERYEIL